MKIGNFEFDLENRTAVVGIVNLTDDSFSGDGIGTDINKALNIIKSFTGTPCPAWYVWVELVLVTFVFSSKSTIWSSELKGDALSWILL